MRHAAKKRLDVNLVDIGNEPFFDNYHGGSYQVNQINKGAEDIRTDGSDHASIDAPFLQTSESAKKQLART